jgi:hypothetical protein
MSSTTFVSKFKKNITVLTRAVTGEVELDRQYPKIYRKVYKFYQDNGVVLYDDPEDDYEIVLDCIASDLESAGVLQ